MQVELSLNLGAGRFLHAAIRASVKFWRFLTSTTLGTSLLIFSMVGALIPALAATAPSQVTIVLAPSVQTKGAAPSGGTFKVQPVTQLQDSRGLNTSGSENVTVTINNGVGGSTDGVLSGTTTVASANGKAFFTNLSVVGGDRVGYDFTFQSPGLKSATIKVTFATQLVITSNPVVGLPGQPLRVQPQVQIADAFGALVSSDSSAVTVAATGCYLGTEPSGGKGFVQGVTADGVVTFPTLYANDSNEVSSCVFKFYSGTLLNSTSITVAAPQPEAGSPTKLVLRTSPVVHTKGAAPSGGTFRVQPILFIKDANDLVTGSSASVTVSISGGFGGTSDGVLQGTTTVSASAGKATFSGLSIQGGNRLGYDFEFRTPGLPAVVQRVSFATSLRLKSLPVLGDPGALALESPVVEIVDAAGVLVPGAADAVAMSSANCSIGAVQGVTSLSVTSTAVKGTATFGAVFANHKTDTNGCTFAFESGSLLTPVSVSTRYFAAKSLQLSNTPGIVTAGQSLKSSVLPELQAVDATGRLAGNFSGQVTYSVVDSYRTTSSFATNGRVTFDESFSWTPAVLNFEQWSAVFSAKGVTTLQVPMYGWLSPQAQYDGNGNAGGSVPEPTVSNASGYADLATNIGALVRPGKKFVGWSTQRDGTGKLLAPGTKFAIPKVGVTLFATWAEDTPDTKTVTFLGNDSDSGLPPASVTLPSGSSFVVPGNSGNLARNGAIFGGWSTSPDGTGSIFRASREVLLGDLNLELFAIWKQSPIQISFDVNGAESGSAPAPMSGLTTDFIALPSNDGGLARDGYSFVGWSSQADGGGLAFAAGATIELPMRDLLLYAHWVPQAQLVTYNSNGALNGAPTFERWGILGKKFTLDDNSNILEREGFTFTGWSKSSTADVADFNSGELVALPSGGLNLFATWKPLATKLVISQLPIAGKSGQILRQQPVIELRDDSGARVATPCKVSVSVTDGSAGAVTGTTVMDAIDGVVRFSNLVISGTSSKSVPLTFTCALLAGKTLVVSTDAAPSKDSAAVSLSGDKFTIYQYLSWPKWVNSQGQVQSTKSTRTPWNVPQDFSDYLDGIRVKPIWVVYESVFSSLATAATPANAVRFTAEGGLAERYVDEVKIKSIADVAAKFPEMPVSFDTEFGRRFDPPTVIPATLKILELFRKYNKVNPIGVYALAPQVMYGWNGTADMKVLATLSEAYRPVAEAVDFLSPMIYYLYNPETSDWVQVANYSLLASAAYGLNKPVIPYMSFNKGDATSEASYLDALHRMKFLTANGAAGAIIWESSIKPPIFNQYAGWGRAMYDYARDDSSTAATPGRPTSIVLSRMPVARDTNQLMVVKPSIRTVDRRKNTADPNVVDTISVSTDNGILTGTTAVKTINGVASFDDLAISKISGDSYTLKFASTMAGDLTVKVDVSRNKPTPSAEPTATPTENPTSPGGPLLNQTSIVKVPASIALKPGSTSAQPKLAGREIVSPIIFGPDSAALSNFEIAKLEKLRNSILDSSSMVVVTGFVKQIGRPAREEKAIAEKRALVVAKRLRRMGLKVALGWFGFGARSTTSGTDADRRVEVRLVKHLK